MKLFFFCWSSKHGKSLQQKNMRRICWLVCQGGLVSLFAPPCPCRRIPQGSGTLCHQSCPGSHGGLGFSTQLPLHVPHGHLGTHTAPQSGRKKLAVYLFSSSLLTGKTGAFLLSEPCLSLLSSILSLPQENNWILFLCSISSVGRIWTWVSSCWCCIASLGKSVSSAHVMCSGLVVSQEQVEGRQHALSWQTCKDWHRLKILVNNYFYFLSVKVCVPLVVKFWLWGFKFIWFGRFPVEGMLSGIWVRNYSGALQFNYWKQQDNWKILINTGLPGI